MSLARKLNPADIAASAAHNTNSKIAGGLTRRETHMAAAASTPLANEMASDISQPIILTPLVSIPTVEGLNEGASRNSLALDTPNQQERAGDEAQPTEGSPAPAWSSGHVALEPYVPTPEITETVNSIRRLHGLRQGIIRAQTKLALQGMAVLRLLNHDAGDYDTDEAKEAARKRNEDLYRKVKDDAEHPLHHAILPYLMAGGPLEDQRTAYEKAMVKAVKTLPVYAWAKNVKGLGDVSLATLVGECGDIGTYKSVSAVWKRLGLAVMSGQRQGNPGANATAEDWIAHGYNKQRRSVSWNARNQIIGGMGLWRPMFGEDLDANSELTYYQRVFAERARYEAAKLDQPVKESAKGKESYTKYVTNRAMRYTEKRMLKHLYIEWRRA